MTKRSTTASSSNDNNTNHLLNKRTKMTTAGEEVNWGDWMGSYKTGAMVDNESERIDRQKAAFGGETIARL